MAYLYIEFTVRHSEDGLDAFNMTTMGGPMERRGSCFVEAVDGNLVNRMGHYIFSTLIFSDHETHRT